MTYGVVVTLLVLALIATVIAVTLTSNQPATTEPAPEPEPGPDSSPPLFSAGHGAPTPLSTANESPDVAQREETTQPDGRTIADVPEEPADDPRTIRI